MIRAYAIKTYKKIRFANPNLNPTHDVFKTFPHVVYYLIKKSNNAILLAASDRALMKVGDQIELITQKTGRTLDIGDVKYVVKSSDLSIHASQISAIANQKDAHFYVITFLEP